MKNLRAKGLMAAAALCGSLGLGLVTHSAPASAAPITIAGCPGSTGSNDTAGISVTVDDALFAGGALVPLHDRTGGAVFDTAALDNAMSTPVCGVQRSAAGVLSYQWLYCTDEPLNVCGNAPWLKNADAPSVTLTNLDKAHLAYILDNVITQPLAGGGVTEASNKTAATRAQRQRLIWCVASHLADGANAPEYLKGFEAPLTCPNWAAIDPTLAANPQITLSAPAGTVSGGTSVTFTLATNVSPLTIAQTGLDSLGLCPASQAGVTLGAGQLVVAGASAGKTVTLCGTRAATGTGSVTASIAGLAASTLSFWQRPNDNLACQGMLSTEAVLQPGATATAQASWQAIDATTVAQTTSTTSHGDPTTSSTTPPTTAPPEVLQTTVVQSVTTLPVTGGSVSTTGYAGLVLLLAGIGLVLVGRRSERDA